MFKIFVDYYTKPDRFETAKRIIDIQDKNGQSVIFKCAQLEKNDMLKCILEHKEIIKEKDLTLLNTNKSSKSGPAKDNKRNENTELKNQIDVYVNKIWDYLKFNDIKPLVDYIESRAETIKKFNPEQSLAEIRSRTVNDQKRGNLFTPLHYAIKFKNLKIICCLVQDYNADTTIENKDGHDVFEYLHMGEISLGKHLFPSAYRYRSSTAR